MDYLSFLDILENDNGLYGELRRTLDGCSNSIYINEGFPYGAGTEAQMKVGYLICRGHKESRSMTS